MCDTLAKPVPGGVLFGKNSDRSPNEPHLVRFYPAADHPKGEMVACTYISVEQAEHTRGVILCRPSWMFGAEMGVNDANVAVGNEAVFTRQRRGAPALTGMDMLRLALERSLSAKEAVETLIRLLETYGQGGDCGFDHPFYYDNSFLCADPERIYALETAGRHWSVTELPGGGSISNRLSADGQFARKHSEPIYTLFSGSKKRRSATRSALPGLASARDVMRVLRGHERGAEGREFTKGTVKSVCMHAGGLIGDHTTGSMVAHLRKDGPATVWLTAASTPCIAAFKPAFFGTEGAPVFSNDEDALAFWLERERLHRAALAGKVDIQSLKSGRDRLEDEFILGEEALFGGGTPAQKDLAEFSAACASKERALISSFSPEGWEDMRVGGRFGSYWRAKNASLGRADNNRAMERS